MSETGGFELSSFKLTRDFLSCSEKLLRWLIEIVYTCERTLSA